MHEALVMSTPLPLDRRDPDAMCITEEGWSAYRRAQRLPTSATCRRRGATNGPAGVRPLSTTIFDIGDGLVIRAPDAI
jgi:hypothetical protein